MCGLPADEALLRVLICVMSWHWFDCSDAPMYALGLPVTPQQPRQGAAHQEVHCCSLRTACTLAIFHVSAQEHKGVVNSIYVKEGSSTECISASSDGSCIIWDLCSFKRRSSLLANTFFKSVVYHPDGSQIVTSGEHRPNLFLRTHALLLSVSSEVAQAGPADHCKGWQQLLTLSKVHSSCECRPGRQCLQRLSQPLCAGTDRKITYWDAFDGQAIRILEGSETEQVSALAIDHDGELIVSGGYDKSVKVREQLPP